MKSADYSTRELTSENLPDFEGFFGKHPAPGAYPCWCLYHHFSRRRTPSYSGSKMGSAAWNRRQKRELVEKDRSHGILVYSGGEPVGWCQYGSWEELPRFDSPDLKSKSSPTTGRLWRITCFTVDRKHRRRGVAKIALRAALDAIGKKGGGLVEAYPITRWGAYREYLGTVSMFKIEGFKFVAPFGPSNVVMRKSVLGR